MGIDYAHYVVPASSAWDFDPTPDQLGATLSVLVDGGWIDPAAEVLLQTVPLAAPLGAKPKRKPVKLKKLRGGFDPALAWTAEFRSPHAPPTVRSDGLSTLYDFEQEGTLRAPFVTRVRLLCPRLLAVLPGDSEGATTVPCPECRAELTRPTHALWPPSLGSDLGIELGLPRVCAHCLTPIDPGQLVGFDRSALTGMQAREPAPFFRVALVLHPAPKATPGQAGLSTARTDPGLLQGLHQATGVPWRGAGLWT